MSSNIYANPDLARKIRYNKGVRGDAGDRVERVVDIYEGVVGFSAGPADSSTRHQGLTHNHLPATKRNPFKAAAFTLALLSLLLIAGISVLFKLYYTAVLKGNQLINEPEGQRGKSFNNLSSSYCQFGKKNETNGDTTVWRKVQCHCYYMSTEKKNWTESQKDCERRKATLLIITDKQKHDLLSQLVKREDDEDSWIGLETVSRDWKLEWQWLDGSLPTYMVWKVGVSLKPEKNSKAFTDPHGKWNHTIKGSKHWICERKIH